MGSPKTDSSRFEALYDWAGIQVFNLIRQEFPFPARTTVLDIGAGWGKYRILLPDFIMDACEIWEPYVEAEHLRDMYRKVIVDDICNVDTGYYDVMIMGDVLEHIPRDKAKELIKRLAKSCTQLYIVVPFLYPQGEVDGNHYEIHHQADLTPEIMLKEYPELDEVALGDGKGIYVRR